MKTVVIATLLSLGMTTIAAADETEAARAARWQDLKHAIFGSREVSEGTELIALDAPVRAQDAATVPLTVTLLPDAEATGDIHTIWILVDDNPSPLAGVFHFGPAADPHTLKTRIRVDQYSFIHAVAETADGRLYSAARFIKASGGCSAPSSTDTKLAMSRLGQIRVRFDPFSKTTKGSTITTQLMINHPNNNGMQVDQLSHNFIPARYIQDIKVKLGDELVMAVEADISMSEDPAITFGLRAHGTDPLRVDVEDSTHTSFHQEFAVSGGS